MNHRFDLLAASMPPWMVGRNSQGSILSRIALAVAGAWLVGSGSQVRAQVPPVITYQGVVRVDDTNFTGTGHFKFALVGPSANLATGHGASPAGAMGAPSPTLMTVTYWSHDGTSVAGSEPTSAVSVSVRQGLFSVGLGDTNLPSMTPLPAAVLTNPEVCVRIWFNNGTLGFRQLTPDQHVSSAAYALLADRVVNVENGPGSGLDADLLDGFDSTGFAPTNHAHGGYAPAIHMHSAAQILSGTLDDSRLSGNIVRLNGDQTFTGSNFFRGVATATNAANTFAGSFRGDGSGLTNLPAAPASTGSATNAAAQAGTLHVTNWLRERVHVLHYTNTTPSSTNILIDFSLANIFQLTLTNHVYFVSPTNQASGQRGEIHFLQNEVGGYVVNYDPAVWKTSGGLWSGATTNANAWDVIGYVVAPHTNWIGFVQTLDLR